jgi:hypothetical protein
MIQSLLAKTEGPNTVWGKTGFHELNYTLEQIQKMFPNPVYRQNGDRIEQLIATEEGENTFWNDFDPESVSVEYLRKFYPPADERLVLRKA